MRQIVIGLGEIGQPLLNILQRTYQNVKGYDSANGTPPLLSADILHICIPYSDKFIAAVKTYQKLYTPTVTVIHSTVPVGTTNKINNAVHSPVLGSHKHMERDIQGFGKWIGGEKAEIVAQVFRLAQIRCRVVAKPEQTELMKLMCLAKYGVIIAFAHYQREVCEELDINPEDLMEWDLDYNLGVEPRLRRPLIYLTDKQIGGHCVIPGVEMLKADYPHELLEGVIKHGAPQRSGGFPRSRVQVSPPDECMGATLHWQGD
mgnify:CR=1 FL=1